MKISKAIYFLVSFISLFLQLSQAHDALESKSSDKQKISEEHKSPNQISNLLTSPIKKDNATPNRPIAPYHRYRSHRFRRPSIKYPKHGPIVPGQNLPTHHHRRFPIRPSGPNPPFPYRRQPRPYYRNRPRPVIVIKSKLTNQEQKNLKSV